MGRQRTEKINFSTRDFETVYSLRQASKLINKDYRTVKKLCTKNNIALVNHRNRYYLAQTQLETLKQI